MDDRITPALYLELTDMGPDEYRDSCVPQVLACPGVSRVSWWRNNKQGRDEIPMELR